MKIKSLITTIALVFSLNLTSCTNSSNLKENIKVENLIKNDDIVLNNEITATSDTIVTMSDIAGFLETKKEHYPLSDEFVEKYQQKSGGYIDNAKKAGIVVNKQLHSPNQKWHFFESWLYPSIEDKSLTWDESAKSRVYSKLICPELLLWIYEACDVNPSKVKEAKEIAEQGKVDGLLPQSIASQMRKKVLWEDLEVSILKFMGTASELYKVNVNQGEGYVIKGLNSEYMVGSKVSFTVDVLDSSKEIKEVRANSEVLAGDNGSYSFTMPNNNVTIYVTLKDSEPITPNDEVYKVSFTSGEGYTISGLNEEYTVGSKVTFTVNVTDTLKEIKEVKMNNEVLKKDSNNTYSFTMPNQDVVISVILKDKVDGPALEGSLAKYDIKFDLGTSKRSKLIESSDVLYQTFELTSEGDSIIDSVSDLSYMYGGGYGGSGATSWVASDMLKFGTTSVEGYFTFNLSVNVSRVIITGYSYSSATKIQVGDSLSSDWTSETNDGKTTTFECSDVNVVNKENVEGNLTSTITIDFESTNSLKISSISKPFFMTSIEFVA